MAGFFDKVSDMAKSAADKGADMVEVTKLNSRIHSEENSINASFAQIGRIYYDNLTAGDIVNDEDVMSLCRKIDASKAVVESLKAEINSIKSN